MKIKKRYYILAILFILYFGIRLYFSLQTEYFSDESSYFALRQIEHIKDTGKPLIHDTLSFQGRTFVFMPLYYYILALFTFLFPTVAIKIVNNLFASLIIMAVYLVSKRILRNRRIALICAFVAAFIPIYIRETLNNITPYAILFPGTFFLLYMFMNMKKEDSHLGLIIPLSLVLVLTSPAVSLIVFGFIIYVIISYLQNLEVERIKYEFIIFFLLFFLWSNFIVFKSAFLAHGFAVIWSNTPSVLISQYFTDINLAYGLTSIGFLTFVFGVYTSYIYLFRKKNRHIALFISFFLSTFILFWLKMIAATLALSFMGTILVILFGQFLRDFFIFLKKTKFADYENIILGLIFAVLILTQIVPSFFLMHQEVSRSPKEDYIDAFRWLKSRGQGTVLTIPEEGNLVTYFGRSKSFMDTNYLLVDNIDQRYKDLRSLYTLKFRIEAIRLFDKYDIDYIMVTPKALEKYRIQEVSYIDSRCFEQVYNDSVEIYKKKPGCEIRNQ